MKCLRTADQFIHTGLEKADEAHQEAHVLLEKWEKFALNMDQRRKLLSVIVSFYKQTEEASEKLSQIEKEIVLEREKIKKLSNSEEENLNMKGTELTIERRNSENNSMSNSTNELTQIHSNLSNQLAEISGRGMREARIVLEKISKDDYEAKHVIRKVAIFSRFVYLKSTILIRIIFVYYRFMNLPNK